MKAENFFHAKTENWNCAQAVLKAYQKEFNIPEKLISGFKAWGGGRAPEGLCGALYAAEFLACHHHLEPIRHDFLKKAGNITCMELKKENKTSCIACVQIAGEIIDDRLKSKNL